MPSKRMYRLVIGSLFLVSFLALSHGYITASASDSGKSIEHEIGDPLTERVLERESAREPEQRVQLVPDRRNTTVVTSFKGPLVAFNPDGTLLYYNNTYKAYWDVDPIPSKENTVLYSATRDLSKEECPADVACTENIVERANLTTGETKRVYSRYSPGTRNNEWHDVDQIGNSQLLIADMAQELVYAVNTTTELREWTWDPQSDFRVGEGGSEALASKGYPTDWTHMNDVERLENGTIMVSLRNQDQIVFIDQETGLLEDLTLGSDGNTEVMFEQHNPDYMPSQTGGPAVIIADSQNNRIVEYQRQNGEWVQSWSWTDEKMLWPRDADRLPNANTLITDTHSHRIIEVDESGNNVWTIEFTGDYKPYEAERLETGDESAHGPSAKSAGLASHGDAGARDSPVITSGDSQSFSVKLYLFVKNIVPSTILNGLMFLVPNWLTVTYLVPLLIMVSVIPIASLMELRWWLQSRGMEVQSPIHFDDKNAR